MSTSGIEPVPQNLYRNTNSTAVATGATPENLYLNINNQPVQVLPPPNVAQPRTNRAAAQPTTAVAMNNIPVPGQAQQQYAAPYGQPAVVQPIGQVALAAHQIRIGSRMFKPANDVSFKDEGILFTLQDFANAPVLLNARAIHRVKLNLTQVVPCVFLYLEMSCMKQIKTIFKINDEEFYDKHMVEIRRCIAIYPHSVSPGDLVSIKTMFHNMQKKYPRRESILEEITPDQAFDLLYNTNSPAPANRTIAAAASAAPAARNSAQQSPRVSVPQQPSGMPTIRATPQFAPRSSPAAVAPRSSTASGQPPILKIPHDSSTWAQMQKGLVNGGVYQVQTQDKQTKYCLWNGSQLVPCLVQNTEVQLECTAIRVGTLVGLSSDFVRVRNDTRAGIGFKFKHKTTNKDVDISVPQTELVSMLLYGENLNTPIFFLNLKPGYVDTVRRLCGMSNDRSAYYNPADPDPQYRHIALFLKNMTKDQKEALLQMKSTAANQQPIMKEISVGESVRILTSMAGKDSAVGSLGAFTSEFKKLTTLIKELTGSVTANGNSAAADDDDDDDDVIMTSEEVGIKCPYTQQVMKDPVKNNHCGHNYEKTAIAEFIARKKGVAKCPFAGCGNPIPLDMNDMQDNADLKQLIEQQKS